VTTSPVVCSAFNNVSTDAVGLPSRRIAKAPATCGVAIDVPAKLANPVASVVVGTEDRIHWPGASNDMNEAMLLNEDTRSRVAAEEPSPVEPTLIAPGAQAGDEMASVKPSLPVAMTVAIPAVFSWAIGVTIELDVHGAVNSSPPRLMLTDAMVLPGNALRWLNTWFKAAIWSEEKLSAHATPPQAGCAPGNREKTWMAIMLAPGATPAPETPVVPPATMPATWVP
jgi:hypothetical protein